MSVQIARLALSNIGKASISDLDEPSAEARACKQFYAHARDVLLQAYPWSFAGRTVALAEVLNDKPGKWARAYAKPNDCLKVRYVRPQYSTGDLVGLTHQEEVSFPYDVEAEKIYCHLSPAFLRYTFKLVDPTRFSPLFVDALSWHLAARIAMPLTRDPKVRNDAYQLAMDLQGKAEVADANETRDNSDHNSEFVEARD